MSTFSHLSRAPVTEASINFQVDASVNWDPGIVRTTLSKLWTTYPEVEEIFPLEMRFTVGQSPADSLQATARAPQGFVFGSPSGALQARRDGFSITRRAPYEDWQSLTAAALEGWREFSSVLNPGGLHGVSVRFSNHLEFDSEEFKLSRYFVVPPAVPPSLNWKFYGFFQEAIYAPPDSPCAVKVLTTPAFVADPKKSMAFILDVEVYLMREFTTLDRTLNSVLAEMQVLKNEAFFSLLTEEAIKRYI